MTTERRRYTRFSKVRGLDVRLHFHTPGKTQVLPPNLELGGMLVNLSSGGGFIETEKFDGLMGAVCTLSIPMPSPLESLSLDARVVRISPRAGDLMGLGLSFLCREEMEEEAEDGRRSRQMERLGEYILDSHALSSIPTVVQNIMSVAASPDSNSKDLAYELGTYPELRERLLEVLNSGLFNLPGETKTIQDAVRMLGFRQICNVAITLAAGNLFGDEMDQVPVSRGFWNHSLACANISEMIANRVEVPVANPYVAGLLHDLGKLVLLYTFQAEYERLRDALRSSDAMVHAMERHLVGMPHDEVNRLLSKKLRFPDELAQALCEHHTTKMPPDNTTAVVHLADVLCHSMHLVFPRGGRRPPVNQKALERLQLKASDMKNIQRRAYSIVDRVDMWASLL